jgi:hypothetical protein
MIVAMQREKRKTISRTRKVNRFLVVDNAVFSDGRLSWEARGMMGYLLSKPDHWQIRIHDLMRRSPAREHKVRRILRELRLAGYLDRRRIQHPDGTFDWVTMIHEAPSGELEDESEGEVRYRLNPAIFGVDDD